MSHHYQLNFDELPASAFLRMKQLIGAGVTPFSASTVWRKVKRGQFPAPTKLSDNITAWNVGAIRQWQAQIAANAEPCHNMGGDA